MRLSDTFEDSRKLRSLDGGIVAPESRTLTASSLRDEAASPVK